MPVSKYSQLRRWLLKGKGVLQEYDNLKLVFQIHRLCNSSKHSTADILDYARTVQSHAGQILYQVLNGNNIPYDKNVLQEVLEITQVSIDLLDEPLYKSPHTPPNSQAWDIELEMIKNHKALKDMK